MRATVRLRLLALLLFPVAASASEEVRQAGDFWVPLAEPGRGAETAARFRLDADGLRSYLSVLPAAEAEGSLPLSLPLPDGRRVPFEVSRSIVMAPELAAKFPELATFQGVAVDGSGLRVRFELSDAGLGAMLFGGGVRLVERDPASGDYVARERQRDALLPPFSCGVRFDDTEQAPKSFAPHLAATSKATGPSLRSYRTAIAATGEYTAAFGGTVAGALRGIVSAVNRVNQVYETDLGIRMVLVADNDRIVYTNGGTDPYTNNNGSAMLNENQTNLTNVIGAANYDLGHVFSTGGGGIASLSSVCNANSKARGVTGSGAPNLDPFWVDYVAHEIGHQLNAPHTFNGTTGSCGGGNRSASQAYEPGSGATIMAYAGICGGENLQPNSDPFFHVISLQTIHAFTQTGAGSTCGAVTATGNQTPLLTATPNRTIPARTPFALTASASDPDAADRLTYLWEQFDLGTATSSATVNTDLGSGPLFRSFDATDSPTRVFPRLANILAGSQTIGEVLPTTNRTLNFRVTARDNRGGVQWTGTSTPAVAQTTLTVVDTGAAFALTGPDAPITWASGSTQTVAWNVAGTTAAPISCANVALVWSSDGGQNFGTVLAASTPNDGSHDIVVPAQATTAGRLRLACADNIFFDINNAPITVTGGNQPPVVALAGGSASYTSNGPAVLIDPAATVSDADSADFAGGNLTATLTNNGGFDDRLEIRNQGTGAGQVGVAGSTVSFGGTAIGTLSGGAGVAPLVVALNASATPAATQALLRNLTFRSTADVTGTLPRTLAVSVADGDGGMSTAATRGIAITLNLDPVLAFMDDADADNLLPVNRAQNWTVAFTKDIDLASVSAADFDNAGSAPVTFGAITEPSAGVLQVPVTPTGAGTVILRLPAAASVLDATGLVVRVPAQDNDAVSVDATRPTLASIDDGDADNSVGPGTTLTYTLVFSEDVDLASFSAADFDNAGTAPVTIGAIAEPTPGTITVAVTATGEGTLLLRVPAAAVVTDVAGNALLVPQQDNDSVQVTADAVFANSFEP
jgi:hypothetical protein